MKANKLLRSKWFIALAAAGVLAVAALLAYVFGLPAYRGWRYERLMSLAREPYAAGDLNNAHLAIRKTLRMYPEQAEAWELAVDIADDLEDPALIFYLRELARLQPEAVEPRLQLAEYGLRVGQREFAKQNLDAVSEQAAGNTQYHKLLFNYYSLNQEWDKAEEQMRTLSELNPDDAEIAFDLAVVRMQKADPGIRKQGLERLLEMRENEPDLNLMANRALIIYAKDRGDEALAREAIQGILEHEDAPFSDKILILDAYYQFDRPAFTKLVNDLKKESSDNPEHATLLANFLNRNGFDWLVADWLTRAPEELLQSETVRRELTRALLEMKDWPELEETLSNSTWEGVEYFRYALLGLAQRRQGKEADFGRSWDLAVNSARGDEFALRNLIEQVETWGWDEERIGLTRQLFQRNPRLDWAAQELIAFYKSEGETSELASIYARMAEIRPDAPEIAAQRARLMILRDTNLSSAINLARKAYESEPENPLYTTVYAAALLKLDEDSRAREILTQLLPGGEIEPETALLYAYVLAGTGQAEAAAEVLNATTFQNMLPEEINLLAGTRTRVTELMEQRS